MTRKYVALTHCPICEAKVDTYEEIDADRPFTAYDPMEGLTVWGAYSVPKETVCYAGGQFIHFRTPGLERLVRMTAAEAA